MKLKIFITFLLIFSGLVSFSQVPTYSIKDIKPFDTSTGVNDSAIVKTKCFIKGLVYSKTFRPKALEFNLQDSTGGLIVFSTKLISGYLPKRGDSLLIRGTVSQYNGLTELTPDSIVILNSFNGLKKSKIVTTLDESTEGDFVRINNVTLTNPAEWDTTLTTSKSGMNVHVVNTSGDTFLIRVDKDVNLYKANAPSGKFDVQGIGTQFDNTNPFLSGYQLLPRDSFDVFKIGTISTNRKIQNLTISQITPFNTTTGVNDSAVAKTRCIISGVANSETFRPGGLEFSLSDRTGSITVFAPKTISGYIPNRGDSLIIRGTVTQYNGLSEFVPDSIVVLSRSTTKKLLNIVRILDELSESNLVKILNVNLVNTSDWDTTKGTKSGMNIKITNGIDTFTMRVDHDVNLYKSTAPLGKFNVTGICSQFDPTSPYLSGYQILPRDTNDIEYMTAVSEISKQNPSLEVYPNPNEGMLTITSSSNIQNISIRDITGRKVFSENVEGFHTHLYLPIPSGIYIMTIRTNDGISNHHIVRK